MIIESNGITIERLREKDIEMVRGWRNSKFVKQYMLHQETITAEMQKKWFKSKDNFNNFYFVLIYKGKKVGLGNINSVDWDKKQGEVGIFVADKSLIGSILPIVGSLTLSDIIFKIFRLERIVAQIREDNPRSKKLSKLIGAKLADKQESEESKLYHISPEDFYKSTKKFFMLMKPMGFSRGSMQISFDNYDIETGFAEKFIKLIENAELNFKKTEIENKIIFTEI